MSIKPETTKINPQEIIIKTPKALKEIKNDYFLALTGYKPNFNFLEQLGIGLSKDENKLPENNTETMKSTMKGVYLAGVICGGLQTYKWFIENSKVHAEIIAKHLDNHKF